MVWKFKFHNLADDLKIKIGCVNQIFLNFIKQD